MYTVDSLRGMVSGGTLHIKTEGIEEQYEFDGKDMYRTEFEEFADALLQDKYPPCTGYDGLHSQRLLDAIYKSAKTGKKTKVK